MTSAAQRSKAPAVVLQETRVLGADHLPAEAILDLVRGFAKFPVWIRFAFQEIRQRFRRSALGPFWLTLSMGIFVGALGMVFSTLFGQDVSHTLPYIAIGLIFWGLLTSCILDGTSVFINNESYIRNVPLPISFHLYRMLARNLMIWGFNMVIYLIALVFFDVAINVNTLLFIPGFALFIINMSWIALASAVLSTRYRDIPQLIISLIQVVFFVTPVFWSPDSLPSRPAFVTFNPFYHLLEIVRAPLLGNIAPLASWAFAVALAVFGMAITIWLYRRAYARIAYWV